MYNAKAEKAATAILTFNMTFLFFLILQMSCFKKLDPDRSDVWSELEGGVINNKELCF